ncbi:hypothetical protein EHV15_35355 [Paenibacillus oralis]|uniref:Uncharacterized protein n=1 Tax=Paenibacillus oralis TaxID=2490856 RepID=A0A3P3TEJ6_9BACL|nr:hypothetical protein [Paenibacillus oralis]RRJ54853.1 hypothetical protein EHV15_35355 [Paenibacillus oralis]
MELFWYSLGVGVTGFIFALSLRLTTGSGVQIKIADIIAMLSSGIIGISFAIYVLAVSIT